MVDEEAKQRLERLAAYLKADPTNGALLFDCAQAAIAVGDDALATALFKRLEALEPLAGGVANTAGIAAIRSGDQQTAQDWFAGALDSDPGDKALRFNIAWSRALGQDFEGAAEMLDSEVVNSLPQAAMLDMQISHELGRFDEAADKMAAFLVMFPAYPPLHAAASVLAMDLDQPDLARESAGRGGDHPDALTTLATLDLGERRLDDARRQYGQALATRPGDPRARIGLGLVDMAEGRMQEAATQLDEGAERFETHLGSWIAAGWAYLLAGDLLKARLRFETALQHDESFGEAQGSLAVVELLQGENASAKRRIAVARRLDGGAFSAALAAMLWEQSQGQPEKADRILQAALRQPILPNGATLTDALAKALSGR